MSDMITLHKVLESPVEHDQEPHYSVVYLAQDHLGEMIQEEIFYLTLDEAYDDVKVVNSTIGGLEIPDDCF